MSVDPPALDRFVDQAGGLYSLPMVAVEILQLTSQPKVDLAALKNCLLRDPALVGKMLRVVNSSLFGLSRGVSDLNQALALLGTKSVRLLVLGFSLPDELFVGLAGEVLHRYWHHTALKAASAREISETIYRMPGEEAFIAGLLQDLGMLVLVQQLGESYVRFLDRAYARSLDIHAAERVTLGFDHVQLTARLLGRWGLPEGLINAIEIGNSPERIAQLPPMQRGLPQVLHLADLLSVMLTEGRADWLGELLQVGQAYHQLTSVQLKALVDSLQEKVSQLADVLSLELPPGVDYRAIFTEAHRQLAGAADDAALELAVVRRSAAALPREDESELLVETELLTEAVKRFTQQPQKKISQGEPRSPMKLPAVAASRGGVKRAWTAVQVSAGPTPSIKSDSLPAKNATTVSPQTDPFLRRLEASIAACRQARRPLSLIFVEIDRLDELQKSRGSQEAYQLTQFVGLVCGGIEHPDKAQLQIGDCRFALILPDCDRTAARELAQQVLAGVRRLSQQQPDVARARFTVSMGSATVAMPPKNFSPAALVDAANRCLHAAQLSSGNSVKTIDVL